MSRVIWKYEVTPQLGVQHLLVPRGGRPIAMKMQGAALKLWLENDLDEVEQERIRFAVIGTGQEVPEGLEHVETVVAGEAVWHLYREPPPTHRGTIDED